MCQDVACGRQERCITNYSVSDIVVCIPFACTQNCAGGGSCCEFCVYMERMDDIFKKLKMSGTLFAMADIRFDTTGVMLEENTACDLAFLDSASSSVKVLKKMPNLHKSRGFRVFCENVQKHIVAQVVSSQRGVHHDVLRTREIHECRRAMMFRIRTKRKFDEEEVVANSFGSMMFRFDGFGCNQTNDSMMSLRDEVFPVPQNQHDSFLHMDCGMSTVGLSDDHRHSEVQMSFPCHVDFVLGSKKFRVFLVRGEQSIIVKKTIEAVSEHASVGEVEPAEYVAFETRSLKEKKRVTPRIDTRKVMAVFENNINQENVERTSRRQGDTDDFIRRPVEFLLPIFFRVLIFHFEFDVLDPSQNRDAVPTTWSILNISDDNFKLSPDGMPINEDDTVVYPTRDVVSHNEAYILSMLFPDSTAVALKNISRAHCKLEKKCEKDIVTNLQGMIQSLYVEITPVFTTVKDVCMDVVMGILKISTGIIWHREHVHKMIHLVSYMDRMIRLPPGHAIEPYVYSIYKLSPAHTACIVALRNTHVSFSKHVFSETICDIVVDIFCGGGILTHADDGRRDLIVESTMPIAQAELEVNHRLGATRVFENERQLRHALALLKKSNGVYKHTDLDERIYKIRDIITENRGQIVLCTLINSLVRKCKLNRVYARVPLAADNMSFRDDVMAFLENIDTCLDGIVANLIDSELASFKVQDARLARRIDEFLVQNTAPANCVPP